MELYCSWWVSATCFECSSGHLQAMFYSVAETCSWLPTTYIKEIIYQSWQFISHLFGCWYHEGALSVSFLSMWKSVLQNITPQNQLHYHSCLCIVIKIVKFGVEQCDMNLSWKIAGSERVKPRASLLFFILFYIIIILYYPAKSLILYVPIFLCCVNMPLSCLIYSLSCCKPSFCICYQFSLPCLNHSSSLSPLFFILV